MAEGSWLKYAVVGIIAIIGIVIALSFFGIIELPPPSQPPTGGEDGGFQAEGPDWGLLLIMIILVPVIIGIALGFRKILGRVKKGVAGARTIRQNPGHVKGVVTSSSHLRSNAEFKVPNAIVKFKNLTTGRESYLRTENDGKYKSMSLIPGPYEVYVADGNIKLRNEEYHIHKTPGIDVEKRGPLDLPPGGEVIANFTVTTDTLNAEAQTATTPITAPQAGYTISVYEIMVNGARVRSADNVQPDDEVDVVFKILKGTKGEDGIKVNFTIDGPAGATLDPQQDETKGGGYATTTVKTMLPGAYTLKAHAKDPTGKEISPFPLPLITTTKGTKILNIKIVEHDRPTVIVKPKDAVKEDTNLKVILWVTDEQNRIVEQHVHIKTDDKEHSIDTGTRPFRIPADEQLEIPSAPNFPYPFKPTKVNTPQLAVKALYPGTNLPLPAKQWLSNNITNAVELKADSNGFYKIKINVSTKAPPSHLALTITGGKKPKDLEEASHWVKPRYTIPEAQPLRIVIFEEVTAISRRTNAGTINTHSGGRYFVSELIRQNNIDGKDVLCILISPATSDLIDKYGLPAGGHYILLGPGTKPGIVEAQIDPRSTADLLNKITEHLKSGKDSIVYIETKTLANASSNREVVDLIMNQIVPNVKGILVVNVGFAKPKTEKALIKSPARGEIDDLIAKVATEPQVGKPETKEDFVLAMY